MMKDEECVREENHFCFFEVISSLLIDSQRICLCEECFEGLMRAVLFDAFLKKEEYGERKRVIE